MMSLSILRLFGRQRAHRQRVDLLAHPIAEHCVDELVARDPALAAERLAHDQSFEMLTVAQDPYPGALKPLFDMALDLFGSDHQRLYLYPSRSSARVRPDASPRKTMTARSARRRLKQLGDSVELGEVLHRGRKVGEAQSGFAFGGLAQPL